MWALSTQAALLPGPTQHETSKPSPQERKAVCVCSVFFPLLSLLGGGGGEDRRRRWAEARASRGSAALPSPQVPIIDCSNLPSPSSVFTVLIPFRGLLVDLLAQGRKRRGSGRRGGTRRRAGGAAEAATRRRRSGGGRRSTATGAKTKVGFFLSSLAGQTHAQFSPSDVSRVIYA